MPNDASVLTEDYKRRVRELLGHLETDNDDEAARLIDEIVKLREESLFRELGKLTREFHDALNSFRLDSRISTLAENEIPDARDRLNYVISMTEQAADQTLNSVEQSMPMCDRLESRTADLSEKWARFVGREMGAEEFRSLARELKEFLASVQDDAPQLRANLQEVLMAQGFQDLTGQIIRRVIDLVEELESKLVDLLRISGQSLVPETNNKEADKERNIDPSGPPVPGVDTAGVVSGQDEVDDLLSSLGF